MRWKRSLSAGGTQCSFGCRARACTCRTRRARSPPPRLCSPARSGSRPHRQAENRAGSCSPSGTCCPRTTSCGLRGTQYTRLRGRVRAGTTRSGRARTCRPPASPQGCTDTRRGCQRT
eukprot:923680-Rhodomonas_salina.1